MCVGGGGGARGRHRKSVAMREITPKGCHTVSHQAVRTRDLYGPRKGACLLGRLIASVPMSHREHS